jgi:hypothetical protein
MKNISKCLMVLGLALSLVGCVMEHEGLLNEEETSEIEGEVTESGGEYTPTSGQVTSPDGDARLALGAAAASPPAPAQIFVPSVDIGIRPSLDPKTYTSSSVIYDWDGFPCGGHRFDAYIKLYVGEATTAQAYVTKVDLHIKATSPNAFTMTPYFTDGSTVWQVPPVSYELATNTWQTFTYDVPNRWFSLSGTTRFVQPVHPHDGACGESTPRFYFKRG